MPSERQPPAPLDIVDRIAYVLIPVAMLLAQGAVVTSIGLALATWFRRVGRAVAVSVTCCAAFSFGWLIFVEARRRDLVKAQVMARINDSASAEFITQILATACPLGAQMMTSRNVGMAARAEPTRLLHRSGDRAPGDDRVCPGRARPVTGHVQSLRRPRVGAASRAPRPPRRREVTAPRGMSDQGTPYRRGQSA